MQWHIATDRLTAETWLAVNLVTAFIASRVIGVFEHSIAQLVALGLLPRTVPTPIPPNAPTSTPG